MGNTNWTSVFFSFLFFFFGRGQRLVGRWTSEEWKLSVMGCIVWNSQINVGEKVNSWKNNHFSVQRCLWDGHRGVADEQATGGWFVSLKLVFGLRLPSFVSFASTDARWGCFLSHVRCALLSFRMKTVPIPRLLPFNFVPSVLWIHAAASSPGLRKRLGGRAVSRSCVTTAKEAIDLTVLQCVSVWIILSALTPCLYFIHSSKRNSSSLSWCLSRDGSQPPQSDLWHDSRLLVTQRYEPTFKFFLQYVSLIN